MALETATDTLYIRQGATFRYGFMLYPPLLNGSGVPILDGDGNVQPDLANPISVASCSARMQIKRAKNTSTAMVTATSGTVNSTTNPFGERIFLDSGSTVGRIDIVLTDQDTDKLTLEDAVFDLEIEWPLIPGDLRPNVDRILEGPVVIDLNVTR